MQLLERLYQARLYQLKDKWMARYPWMDDLIAEELAVGELYEETEHRNPLHCNYDD